MKTTIGLTLAAIMSFQTVAHAESLVHRQISSVQARQQVSVKDLSLEELEQSLQELKVKLADLKVDLIDAEKEDGDRLAIKVRNGIALTTIGAVVYNALRATREGGVSDDKIGNAVAFFLLGAVGTAAVMASQGYIYLTRSEIRSLKEEIDQLTEKIARLEVKINQRKAALRN